MVINHQFSFLIYTFSDFLGSQGSKGYILENIPLLLQTGMKKS